MKPSRSNCPSDATYQGSVLIPYITGTSEKFRRIGKRFNVRTIFKSKHTLRGTLMKTGPVRDAQQTKQCVYSIPCDCSRCYIGERGRPLHKYNLTQCLLEKSKLAQRAYGKKPQTMLEWSASLADWTKHHIQEIQGILPHGSDKIIRSVNPAWTSLPSGHPLS
jgi:hypothetical protein